ncbi:hypothetical protein GCM10009119_06430 [Algoriphagus jejuensis]|uniref:Peptidase M1 membrane alanine aminopeptidase domain-containing protein n=1 Tax=Algoriphagus jejuensis TaxID=419934 RepID=A0ABP3Y876_9BACT
MSDFLSFRTIALFAFLLFLLFEVSAQTQSLKGKVISKQTGEEIPFAHIYLPESGKGAIAGLKGDFELALPMALPEQVLLRVSCLGFKDAELSWSIGSGFLEIALEEEFLDLQGVEIRPEDPVALLRAAALNIPKNYGSDSAFIQGYYRNSAMLDNKALRYTEAFIDIIQPPYELHDAEQDLVGDSIHVREVRTKPTEFEDWKVQLMTPFENNTYQFLFRDVARDFTSSVQREMFISNYHFELEDRVSIEGRPAYKISLQPKTNHKYAIWSGHLYLDVETLAYVKIDFISTEKAFKKLKSQAAFILVSNLYKFHYKAGEWREVIQSKFDGERWVLDEINSSKVFEISSKPRGMDHAPLVYTLHFKADKKSQVPANYSKPFLSNDIGQANTYFQENYDSEFWVAFDQSRGVETKEVYGFKEVSPDQKPYEFSRLDTLKGALTPLRTAYDVGFYHLDVEVFPEEEVIAGSSLIRFKVIESTDKIQVDLYSQMQIDSILYQSQALDFSREHDAVTVRFPESLKRDSTEEIQVYFRGRPLDFDPQIPMYASFLWTQDANDHPWIQAICQGYGASGWWPNKDHLSDEPDSARISIIHPADLVSIANGRKVGEYSLGNGKTRTSWAVSYPINNYNLILYLGNYETLKGQLVGLEGTMAFEMDVLKDHVAIGEKKKSQVQPVLDSFEKYFGPYPFPRDGIRFVDAPHAMEHQSAVALGTEFFTEEEKDWEEYTNENFAKGWIPAQLLLHEFAHEWWGNSLSCTDNAELWIHEAFATYAESLFLEDRYGYESAQIYLNSMRTEMKHETPLIGEFGLNHIHYDIGDMYTKGALFLDALRKLAGDEVWFAYLKELQTTFRHQSITSQDLEELLSERTGQDLSLLFQHYLHEKELPKLEYYVKSQDGKTTLFYRLDKDLGAVKIPVVLNTISKKEVKIYPTMEWQDLSLDVDSAENFKFDESSFLLEYSKITAIP